MQNQLVKKILNEDYNKWAVKYQKILNEEPFEAFCLIPGMKDTNEEYIPFGVYSDEELVGELLLQFNNKNVVIKSFFVLEEYRGNGFGGKLVDHAIVFCEKQKCGSILIETNTADNIRKLFMKRDFNEVYEEGEYTSFCRVL